MKNAGKDAEKREPYTLLVGMQNDATAMETVSVIERSQKHYYHVTQKFQSWVYIPLKAEKTN